MNSLPKSPTMPLSRFRVIELTLARAGPSAGRHLADWGADVIRVEPPLALTASEDFIGKRSGFDQQNLHRNKRSLSINLQTARGKDVFMQLVKTADVVIENMRSNVKHKLGVDYESLRKINPRIVYGNISGFGQTGPYASRPGVDQIVQGMGGLMSVTGLPGQGPVRSGIAVLDMSAGAFLCQAVLIALLEREVTGVGRWVHTSLLESAIAMLDFQAARYLMDGEVAGQAGNDHPTLTPSGVFPCSDGGFVSISAAGERMWRRFCDAVNRPDLLERPEYASGKARSANRVKLNEEVSEITRQQTGEYWAELLNTAGVPSGPIYSIDQLFADPQVRHLNMSLPLMSAMEEGPKYVGQPATFEGLEKQVFSKMANLGEHNNVILEELGYTQDEISALKAEAVV